MKLFTPVLKMTAVALVSLSVAGIAQAASYPASVENDLVRICKAIKEDNTLKLHRAVKQSGLNYRTLDEGLVCNGQDMRSFAITHNAMSASAFLVDKTTLSDDTLTAKR